MEVVSKGIDEAFVNGAERQVHHGAEARKIIEDAVKQADTPWLPLQELPSTTIKAPFLPLDLVPKSLRVAVKDVSDRMQVNLESVTIFFFGAIATIVGRKVAVFPKRFDTWAEVIVLWTLLIARPGKMKTPTMNEALKYLHALERAAFEKYSEQVELSKGSIFVKESKIEAIKDKITKAIKSGQDTDISGLQNDLVLAETELAAEISALFPKRYRTNDATVEKIAVLMEQNPNGFAYVRDELSGWLLGFEKHGREGDREFFLECANGNGNWNFDRIGRPSGFIDGLCLQVMGGIQPGKLESYVVNAAAGGKGDDGLLQRFNLAIYPEHLSLPYLDRRPDTDATNKMERLFKKLDQATAADFGAEVRGGKGIPGIGFSEKAQAFFEAWFKDLTDRLSKPDLSELLEAHLCKYKGLMPKLALLFHVTAWAAGEEVEKGISEEHAILAAQWCEFLEKHAMKMYAGALFKVERAGNALAKRILDGKVKDGYNIRDLYNHHWSMLASADAFEEAAAFLALHNWVRIGSVKGELGRPSLIIRLHPDLIRKQKS